MDSESAPAVAVTVQLPSLLLECTRGQREVEVEAATLAGCVEDLLARYPLLEVHLFAQGRELRGHVNVFHNDTNLRWLDDWNRPVRAGDTLKGDRAGTLGSYWPGRLHSHADSRDCTITDSSRIGSLISCSGPCGASLSKNSESPVRSR